MATTSPSAEQYAATHSSPIKLRGITDVVSYIDARPGIRGKAGLIWWLLLGGLFLDAFSNSALSAGLGPMTKDLDLSPGQVALLTSMASWVTIVVYPISGAIADRVGRFKLIIIAKFLAIIGAVLAAFAPGFGLVVLGRLFVGTAYGVDFAVAIALIAEMTPKKFSSRLNAWQGIWYTAVASNLILAIGFYNVGTGDAIWRYAVGSAGVVALVLLIFQAIFVVESPTWLARKERLDLCAESMTKIFSEPFVAAPVEEREAVRNVAKPGIKNTFLIFRGIYLPRTILAGTVQIAQALQYFAVGWYLPIISLTLFGQDFVRATLGALFFNLFGIVGGFTSASVAKRLGLRRASAFGFSAVAVILVVLGVWLEDLPLWLAVTLPSLFILFHSIGPGANGKSLSSLSFRSEIRAGANGFIGAVGGLGAALGLVVFPLLRDALGLGTTFIILALVPASAAVICFIIKWEPSRSEVPVDEELDAPNFDDDNVVASKGAAL